MLDHFQEIALQLYIEFMYFIFSCFMTLWYCRYTVNVIKFVNLVLSIFFILSLTESEQMCDLNM